MKKVKQLEKALSFYKVDDEKNAGKEKALNDIVKLNIRAVPRFSMSDFLFGVIHSLSKWFFVGCGFYVLALFIISFALKDDDKLIYISTLSPFLAIGSAGAIYYNIQPSYIELENSCLYKPKTVFAGKLLICGIFDLIAVVLGSFLASLSGAASVKSVVILSLLCFVLSSLIVLSLCVSFKPKIALAISLGITLLILFTFFSKKDMLIAALNRVMGYLPYVTVLLSLILCLVCFLIVKNFEYESLVRKYEN